MTELQFLQKEVSRLLEENSNLKDENKQLHISVALQAEAYQSSLKKEHNSMQRRLDQQEEKIDSYTQLIEIHKKLGGEIES